jgi:ribosomal protein L7/L12
MNKMVIDSIKSGLLQTIVFFAVFFGVERKMSHRFTDIWFIVPAAIMFPVIFTYGQYRERRNKQSKLIEIKRRIESGPIPFGCSEELATSILTGEKNQAIKLYREEYGVGLKEAKDAVDSMLPAALIALLSADSAKTLNQLLVEHKKIQAVKLFREQTGAELRQAKDAVDYFETNLNILTTAQSSRDTG